MPVTQSTRKNKGIKRKAVDPDTEEDDEPPKGLPQRAKVKFGNNREISTYFQIDTVTGEYSGIPGKRPGNQSSASNVRKVVEYLTETVPQKFRHEIQQHFIDSYYEGDRLSEMNDGNGIDIAHVISAHELKRILTGVLNMAAKLKKSGTQPGIKTIQKDIREFADGFITTDASDADDVAELADRMASGSTPEERGRAADALLSRLNRVRKNLTGGDASTNRKIAEWRDVWSRVDGLVAEPVAKRLKLMERTSKKLGIQELQSKTERGRELSSTFSRHK